MRLYDFLFCDDVRIEINNKLSLMGLFTDKIIIPLNINSSTNFPIPLNLALVLRFQLDSKDEIPENFKFEYCMNKKSILKATGNIETKKNQTSFNLIIKCQNIPIEPGNLNFKIILLKKEKILFTEMKEEAIEIVTQ